MTHGTTYEITPSSSSTDIALAELFEAKASSQIGDGYAGIDISRVGTYL